MSKGFNLTRRALLGSALILPAMAADAQMGVIRRVGNFRGGLRLFSARRLWTPLDLGSALHSWWDFSDTTNTAVADFGFSVCNNKGASGKPLLQTTNSNRPTVTSSNGLQIAQFNGTSNYMLATAFTLPQPFTMAAFLITGSSRNQYESVIDANATPENSILYRTRQDSSGLMLAGSRNASIPVFANSTPAFTVATWNGTSSSEVRNGTTTTSNLNIGTGGPSNEPFAVGGRANSNQDAYYVGFIGDVILINRTLTTTEQQLMEGYLAWKWGVQGLLPNTHPYKTFPPLVGG